jgi:hypothetical protein
MMARAVLHLTDSDVMRGAANVEWPPAGTISEEDRREGLALDRTLMCSGLPYRLLARLSLTSLLCLTSAADERPIGPVYLRTSGLGEFQKVIARAK